MLIHPDGSIYEGLLKEGVPHSYGREVKKHEVYIGEICNGKRQGNGQLFNESF